jgi:hypothetical protein
VFGVVTPLIPEEPKSVFEDWEKCETEVEVG